MAMMAIAAVYEPYEIVRMNHGMAMRPLRYELIPPDLGAGARLTGKLHLSFSIRTGR